MDATRAAVFVCAVLCSAARAEPVAGKLDGGLPPGEGIAHDDPRASRVSHRVQLLFPLLLRISTRLATLVPTAIMGLIGIFLFVAFSKKAFIISLLALFLTYLDKYKRDEEGIVHIHKINLYNEDEVLAHNEEHLHYGVWPQRKRLAYPLPPRPYPYGHWPGPPRPGYPVRLRWQPLPPRRPQRPPPELEGVRRTSHHGNGTVPSDFDEFLSQSVDSGPNSVRYFF